MWVWLEVIETVQRKKLLMPKLGSIPRPIHAVCSWALRTLVPEWYWPRSINVDGVQIQIRDTPYTFSTRQILCAGKYERPERTLVNRVIKPGMQVLEFGGSIGIVTAVVAHRCGPTGRVISVEASPRLVGYSKKWLELSPHVTVLAGYAFPLWTLPDGLRIDGFSGGNVSLGGRVEYSVARAAAEGGLEDRLAGDSIGAPISASINAPIGVPVAKNNASQSLNKLHIASSDLTSFDMSSLCARFGVQPDALVMDIESAEAVIVSHRPNYPPSLQTIVAELHPWMYANGTKDLDAILHAYAREGFRHSETIENTFLFER